MGTLIPFRLRRPALKPAVPDAHPALIAAALAIITPRKDKPMQNVRRHRLAATVTHAAEHAVRLDLHTPLGRTVFALSPSRADELRRDLTTLLIRLRRDADEASKATGTPYAGIGSSAQPARRAVGWPR